MTCFARVAVMISLLVSACGGPPSGPSAQLSQEFTLAPGNTMRVDGTPLRVTFLRATGDSRCPGDAICIQGGDATVHIRATASTTAEYELHTGDAQRASATHAGLVITLKDVQPYPFASKPPIQANDYRVTLVVTRGTAGQV